MGSLGDILFGAPEPLKEGEEPVQPIKTRTLREQKQSIEPQQERKGIVESAIGYRNKLFASMRNSSIANIPSTERTGSRPSTFKFKRGDVRGNLQQLLRRAESPDYITAAGGEKLPQIRGMTVAQIGAKWGNRAMGRYQIQRDTALEALKNAKLDANKFVFDEAGQEKLFDLLLEQRGKISDYRAGKITKEQVAYNLSTIWAGLPKDRSGRSRYDKVGKNKAHVKWLDLLAALD